MRRLLLRSVMLLVLLALSACGEPRAALLPEAVAAALAALTADCSAVGGVPRAENAVRRADLNGDAQDDFVLYAGWIECENAWSIYGDREKMLNVFAGGGGGAAADAFQDWVYDAKIETGNGAPTLWLTTSALQCGRPRAETFADEVFCDRAIVWDQPQFRFVYAPVSTVRTIE